MNAPSRHAIGVQLPAFELHIQAFELLVVGKEIGLPLHKLSKILWVHSTVLATAPGFAVEVLVVSWLWRHPIRCASHLDYLDLEAWEMFVLSRHHLSP